MYYIGIDIGGTTIKGGIVEKDGTIVYKSSIPTVPDAGCELFAKSVADFCVQLTKEANISMDSVISVGMGIPGTVEGKTGMVIYSNNIDLKNAPIVKEFQRYIDKPVYIDNDANCAALGEYFALNDSSIKDFVAVTLGTGVGGGIVIDGKLFSGFGGGGGELGHMVIAMDGEECTCGRCGCWEAYASATALVRQAQKAAKENPESLLFERIEENDGRANGKIVWDTAKDGDATAKDVTAKYALYVAQGVVNIVNIFRPEVIAIGGGVSRAGDALLEPVKKYVSEKHYGVGFSKPSDIVIAKLGNDAGIVGAAFLGRSC